MMRCISLALLGLVLSHSANAESISVSKTCFAVDEVIQVNFQKNADGNLGSAWIAIYKSSALSNTNDLPDGELWVNLCGTTSCNTANNPVQGSVRFRGNQNQDWQQQWPLAAGTYRAVLTFGDDGETWPALAMSAEFQVGCGSTPTVVPNVPSPAPPSNDMVGVIANARSDIEDLIARAPLLVGKFLRLIFHDCVGGCDGCIDMTNPDNAGLMIPIDALEPIVARFESQGLSRTDIWMLSAVVASDVSEQTTGLGFPFQWIGRKTCDQINNGNCGLNSQGLPSSCIAEEGPHRALCHADTAGTLTIQEFMIDAFGFDAQQTAAIMGAHTVGAMRAVNLGFEGRNGWDRTNDELDQGYFSELVGDEAPEWEQVQRSNSNLDGIPPRFQFEASSNGIALTMLNSDIALVRNLVEGQNLMSDGRVTCNFSGDNACDDNTPFMPFIERYAASRSVFLADFRDALELMIENGYRRDTSCGQNQVCVLTLRPTRSPTPRPTRRPTPRPTRRPTPRPTRRPTPRPTRRPTPRPTRAPV